MTVLDVLKTASLYSNISDTLEPIFNEDETIPSASLAEFAVLLGAFNRAVKKIASNYLDCLSASVVTINSDGEFDLSSLSLRCRKVLSLFSGRKKLKFKVKGDTLFTSFSGIATITFAYIPDDYLSTSDFDPFPQLDIGTLSMAVASEYAYTKAIYDDAQMWQERFLDSISNIKSRTISNGYIEERIWR